MKSFNKLLIIFVTIFTLFISCKKQKVNVFGINEDKKLGAQMDQYIRDSSGYVLLDSAKYPEIYAHVNSIKNQILNSGEIKYKTDFPWKVTIIKDDSTLNAFATPGGYIFVYTGLIKYLDCGDHFAGVLGHEMAHADRRHSTQQLTQAYGTELLFSIALGKNQGQIAGITKNLLSLKFSRNHETEADEYSVKYLCHVSNTGSDGAAGFFQKLIAQGQAGNTPQFLSTHPSPANRVEDIKNKAAQSGCSTVQTCSEDFIKAKNTLP